MNATASTATPPASRSPAARQNPPCPEPMRGTCSVSIAPAPPPARSTYGATSPVDDRNQRSVDAMVRQGTPPSSSHASAYVRRGGRRIRRRAARSSQLVIRASLRDPYYKPRANSGHGESLAYLA